MDTSKHTKTPWRIGAGTGFGKGAVVADEPVPEISGSDAIDYYGGHLIAESIAPRNAAFIVRAANSHDPLVAALKEIVESAKAADQGDIEAWAQELYECGKTARAALAAAGA